MSRSSASGTIQNSGRFGGGGGFIYSRDSAGGTDRQSRQTSNNRGSIERPQPSNPNALGSKYLQPTVASINRSKGASSKLLPASLRERIFELEDTVLEIKSVSIQNVATLQTQLEKEEKENAKAAQSVNSQIQTLKQAIGTLADAVTEEIDSLKKQMTADIESSLQSQAFRLEEQISSFLAKQDHEQSKASFDIRNIKDEIQTLQALEYKSIEKLKTDVDDKLLAMKSDNKKLFEQLRMIISSNSQQITVVTKELEHTGQTLELNRTQVNNMNENYQDFMKKLLQIDKETTTALKHQSSEMIDIKSLLKDQDQFNTALKTQLEQLTRNLDLKNQTYFQSVSEQIQTLSIKSEGYDKQFKKLKNEIEGVQQTQKEQLKQQIQQIQQKLELYDQQRSSFENSYSRKINSVEDLFETQRKELFASMTDLEKILTKKSDNVGRAIREITQQLNISNPLLTY